MQVIQSDRFIFELQEITDFIALDSAFYADKFQRALLAELETLSFMPRRCRKSIHADNPNIRDFIFKGYTVPFLVDDEGDQVVLLGICKQNLWYYEE